MRKKTGAGCVERAPILGNLIRVASWLCGIGFTILVASPLQAQVEGPLYQVTVRGVPMYCRSHFGEPVAVYLNYQLPDVGMANRLINGTPIIMINPNVTNQYSDLVTQWWFAHECGHHALPPALNSEVNADCFAVRELRRLGLLYTPEQLIAFAYELGNLPGSQMGHLPGPMRAQHIARCALQ